MKKLYTLIAATMFAGLSFGQYDFSLTLTDPTSGSTITPTATTTLAFDMKKVSGDDIAVGDTAWIYLYNIDTDVMYSLNGQAGYSNMLPITAQVAGLINTTTISSNMLNQGNNFTFNFTASGFNVGDEISVVLDFSSDNDSAFGNNYDSFYLGSPATTSIVDAKRLFKAFPNPAVTELNIETTEEVVSVVVTSLDGKVVLTSNSGKVNVESLTSGSYIYTATTESGLTSVNKFIKK